MSVANRIEIFTKPAAVRRRDGAAAEAIEDAVKRTISAGVMTADIVRDGQTPCGTQAFGDAVVQQLEGPMAA